MMFDTNKMTGEFENQLEFWDSLDFGLSDAITEEEMCIRDRYRDDTAENGNFGAFTTNRPANAAKAMGCSSVIIGHCEERRDKAGILG